MGFLGISLKDQHPRMFTLLEGGYVFVAISQTGAFIQGMNLWLGVGSVFSLVIGIILLGLSFGSLTGAVVALYGAHNGWHWEWWQAALLTFPFAILASLR